MASGDSLFVLTPGAIDAPDATGLAPYSVVAAATGQRPVLLYDDTADEDAIWSSVLPRHYGGGGLTIDIYAAMAGANSGTKKVQWDVQIERVVVGDGIGSGGSDFAAANSANPTVDNTADNVFKGTVTFTDGADMDSLAAGEAFRIRILRKATAGAGSDDAVGDCQLIRVECRET